MNNDNTPPTPFPLWTTISIFVCVLVIGIFLNFSSAVNFWASQINPQTLEFYKAIFTVIVALIAAGIAGVIQWRQSQTAYRQWQTAQRKLNFDLFDKRFTVYEAVQKTNLNLLFSTDLLADINSFNESTRSAEWLFNSELSECLRFNYMLVAQEKLIEINVYRKRGETENNNYKQLFSAYIEWNDIRHAEIKKLFDPFLKLDNT